MIKSFRNKGLSEYYTKGTTRKLSVQNSGRIRRILEQLNAASVAEDMNLPGNRFHRLLGEDRYSVRVTGNWRITFAFENGDALDVDLEDYH